MININQNYSMDNKLMSKKKLKTKELTDIDIKRLISKYEKQLCQIRSGEIKSDAEEWLKYQIWYWKGRLTGQEIDYESI